MDGIRRVGGAEGRAPASCRTHPGDIWSGVGSRPFPGPVFFSFCKAGRSGFLFLRIPIPPDGTTPTLDNSISPIRDVHWRHLFRPGFSPRDATAVSGGAPFPGAWNHIPSPEEGMIRAIVSHPRHGCRFEPLSSQGAEIGMAMTLPLSWAGRSGVKGMW